MLWRFLVLIPLGFVIGAFGTLIGAGGGFVLMPVLLLLYPQEKPELLTCISLAVVFFNALSGSAAYARMGRIHYRSGLLLSAPTIPGAIIGALVTAYLPRQLFNGIFGLSMLAVAIFLLLHPGGERRNKPVNPKRYLTCSLVETDGTRHIFSYKPLIGIGFSLLVGFVSSLLGIGGGIIHVPALVYLCNFPVHIATATSHFILAVMSFTGTGVHILSGTFSRGLRRTICLSIGVLLGAQVGAQLSRRVHGDWIIRALAVALGFVAVRILIMAF